MKRKISLRSPCRLRAGRLPSHLRSTRHFLRGERRAEGVVHDDEREQETEEAEAPAIFEAVRTAPCLTEPGSGIIFSVAADDFFPLGASRA